MAEMDTKMRGRRLEHRRMIRPAALLWALLAWPWPAWACRYDDLARRIADWHRLPPDVLLIILHAESSGRAGIVGPGGARGLTQFEARTWARVMPGVSFDRAFDPATNLEAACRHLAENRAEGQRDPRSYLSYHNAGVRDHRRLARRWKAFHPNKIYRAAYRAGRRA